MKFDFHQHSDEELIAMWGRKLRAMRLEANISQADLARSTGMSRSSIAGIENGRNFSAESLISILRALNRLETLSVFLTEETTRLTPMELYRLEKKKRKRGGYKK